MRVNRLLLVLSLTGFAASPAGAQSKELPKVRSLGQPVDSVLLGLTSTPSVRVLSNGRLLATDLFSRRLIMVTEDLRSVDTLFDASSPAPLTYPSGFSQLISGTGDTTLFYDSGARGYRVIDPSGRVVRRLSVADPSMTLALQSPGSQSAVDPKGRMVVVTQRWYLGTKRVTGLQPQAESLMLARIALDRPGYDSVTAIMGSGQRTIVTDSTKQPPTLAMIMPVVDRGDAWTMTSTGAIAIVRSSDFHVEWIEPDGSRRSSPPVSWPWAKYSQAERDSMIASREAMLTSGNTRSVSGNGAAMAPPPVERRMDVVPERVPAFAPSSARADRDGRIWIELGPRVMGPPPTTPSVFGIIDATGQIVERVELPPRRTLAGFDRLGYVYALTSVRGGFQLERYLYRKP